MSDPRDDFRAALLAALGNAPDDIEAGRLHRFSTNGKRGDLSGWCQLFDDCRAGVFGDFRAGSSSVWTATRGDALTAAERADLARATAAARAQREADKVAAWGEQSHRLARLWASCLPVAADGTGTDPATLYLRSRLALADGEALTVPDVLRLHPGMEYHHEGQSAGRWPALVGAIQGPDGAAVALHRTWLTPEGRKAPTPGPVKKLTPACGPVLSGCIRLGWLVDGDAGALGIAEGIETAMAAHCASGVPTVAAYSAGALAAWQWPPGLRRLLIFADADAAGADAAEKLRARALCAGLSVRVLVPTTPGTDWCDVWTQRQPGHQGTREVST